MGRLNEKKSHPSLAIVTQTFCYSLFYYYIQIMQLHICSAHPTLIHKVFISVVDSDNFRWGITTLPLPLSMPSLFCFSFVRGFYPRDVLSVLFCHVIPLTIQRSWLMMNDTKTKNDDVGALSNKLLLIVRFCFIAKLMKHAKKICKDFLSIMCPTTKQPVIS